MCKLLVRASSWMRIEGGTSPEVGKAFGKENKTPTKSGQTTTRSLEGMQVSTLDSSSTPSHMVPVPTPAKKPLKVQG